jgi:hypothetical protein
MSRPSVERVAMPTKFGEMPAATAGVIIWVLVLVQEGWLVGLEYSWLLLLGLLLGGWTLLMRLRYGPDRLRRTIGPWRCQVDLTALESVTWRMTGGRRSQGTIFVRDRYGGCVPIYVGRFNHTEEWGPLLLNAAAHCDAPVDHHSRAALDHDQPKVANRL